MYGYQGGKGWGGRNWETGIDTYTLLILCIKWTTDGNMLLAQGTHLVLCGNLNGREVQKAGDICMCMADSFCCAAEANTTL